MMTIRCEGRIGNSDGSGSLSAWEKVGNAIAAGGGSARSESTNEAYPAPSKVNAAP